MSSAHTIDQWDARPIGTTFTDTLEVSLQKFRSSNFEAFFDNLGSELIHAVLGCIAEDMVDSAASISGSAMLADVLDTPVPKLPMGNDVDAVENFVDAWTLFVGRINQAGPNQ